MRKLATGLAWLAALSSVGCKGILDVPNNNSPDIARSYSTPSVLDQLIATGYQQIHTAIQGSSSIEPQAQVLAFESYGTVANFAMNTRESLPRSVIDNTPNNQSATEDFRDFSKLSQQSRYEANYVQSLDALTKSGGHLGSPTGAAADTINLPGQDLRARSYAFFCDGVALGNLALIYDSAAIVTPATPSTAVPALSSYSDVMKAALAMMDSAIAIATQPKAAAGFPLPSNYLNGNTYSLAQYLAWIHSYKARFRAGVARTPAERAAVDWSSVLADANAGIQSDVVIQISSGAGWGLGWLGSQMFQSNSAGWHEIPLMIFGMADTTGAYTTFVSVPTSARQNFLVRTPDKRWPSGDTRAAQQTASPGTSGWDMTKFPYIRNRNAADPPGDAWGSSDYDFYRFHGVFEGANNNTGPWVAMAKVEIQMLAAEADIIKGDLTDAATLINASRTRAGLPPILPQQDAGLNYSSCVPRVPTSAGTTTQCGNILEAMKYEKRMETAYTGYAQWWVDARGWGDLPVGSATSWPVPYQEMQARNHPFYDLGGPGGQQAAAKGTYGF